MAAQSLLTWIIIGIIAGWLTGKIMKGSGYGVLGDLVLGIVGAIVGGWVAGLLGIGAYGLIGTLLIAVLGAVLVVALVRALKHA
ncbi:MAG: GlsB/YeaQ/YmgE family stress response membrane protein [Terriglobales bacterium]